MKYFNYLYDDDIPKYRKKRNKVRKSPKINHKHEYKKVIVHSLTYNSVSLGEICQICGKIKITKWLVTSHIYSDECNLVRVLLKLEDVKKNYPDLEVIEEV